MPKLSPLASVSATRDVLARHGLATKKVLGQHFLISDGVVERICEAAGLDTKDIVLEVGPGIGTLTVALAQKAGAVVAVERDKDLPAVLADTCSNYRDRLAVISKDALELTKDEVSKALRGLNSAESNKAESSEIDASLKDKSQNFPKKLVSNLPYAVAATIILDFFARFEELESATVMVQSEVADRICAQPGTKAYGAYTVKLALYAQVVERFTVGPKNFFPPPRVNSAVVRLDKRTLRDLSGELVADEVRRAACVMADAAFANRRKTLSNSCKTYFDLLGEAGETIKEQLPALFARAQIDPKSRGETLTYHEFIALGKALVQACEKNDVDVPSLRA